MTQMDGVLAYLQNNIPAYLEAQGLPALKVRDRYTIQDVKAGLLPGIWFSWETWDDDNEPTPGSQYLDMGADLEIVYVGKDAERTTWAIAAALKAWSWDHPHLGGKVDGWQMERGYMYPLPDKSKSAMAIELSVKIRV